MVGFNHCNFKPLNQTEYISSGEYFMNDCVESFSHQKTCAGQLKEYVQYYTQNYKVRL